MSKQRETYPVSGIGDKKQLHDTSAKVLELKSNIPGLIILTTHDPGAAEQLHTLSEYAKV